MSDYVPDTILAAFIEANNPGSFGTYDPYPIYTTDTELTTTINDLINGAPGALNTLNELAAALGNDSNLATTITNSLATKLTAASNLSDLASTATAKTNLALNNVDNTSDVNKPISTITQSAIDLRPIRLYISSGSYPSRPASGYVEFIGPVNPGFQLLPGDTWIDTTPALTHYRKRKTADASPITSNTTAATDNDLSGFSVSASEIVELDLLIRYNSPDTADLKVVVLGPSGCTIYLAQRALSTAAVTTATTSSMNFLEVTPGGSAATTAGGSTNSGSLYAWYHGTLINAGTPGTISVQFAQGTSDAGNTIVRAGSRLIIAREF